MTYDEVIAEYTEKLQDLALDPRLAGGILAQLNNKMIDVAKYKLADTQKDLEFAESVKLFMNELANHNITIHIERKDKET